MPTLRSRTSQSPVRSAQRAFVSVYPGNANTIHARGSHINSKGPVVFNSVTRYKAVLYKTQHRQLKNGGFPRGGGSGDDQILVGLKCLGVGEIHIRIGRLTVGKTLLWTGLKFMNENTCRSRSS